MVNPKRDEKQKKYPVIGGNEQVQVHAVRNERYTPGLPVAITVHTRIGLDPRANFALACIEKWGMVTGAPDGEDSAGRAKVRRATPEDIVEHACGCAEAAFKAFEARKWSFQMPSVEQAIDAVKDQEDSND